MRTLKGTMVEAVCLSRPGSSARRAACSLPSSDCAYDLTSAELLNSLWWVPAGKGRPGRFSSPKDATTHLWRLLVTHTVML